MTRHNPRGFSLIEAAIVLAVVGGVIGAIWVAASAVIYKLQENKFSQGFLTYKSNVERYLTQTTPCTGGMGGGYVIYAWPELHELLYPQEWREIDIDKFCQGGTCSASGIYCDSNDTRFLEISPMFPNDAVCRRFKDRMEKVGIWTGSACNWWSPNLLMRFDIPRRD